eukprot:scaffold238838_cov34-Tisochrysis_lutea.AAC.1
MKGLPPKRRGASGWEERERETGEPSNEGKRGRERAQLPHSRYCVRATFLFLYTVVTHLGYSLSHYASRVRSNNVIITTMSICTATATSHALTRQTRQSWSH